MANEIEEIPESKQVFLAGACFGYFDEKFEDCKSCASKNACQQATASSLIDEIRAVPKTSNEIIEKLISQFK